jgi:hypothetical protein
VDGLFVFSDVVRGESPFLLGKLIFKGLTARRLYKSFGVKGLRKYNVVGRGIGGLVF